MTASGFVLLDKPEGITSRRAGARVARLFGAKTFGHIGTLDPMASGLLVIALDEATKMIPFLEGQGTRDEGKEYLFSIKWGIRTDTGDITGKISERNDSVPEEAEVLKILPELVGEYEQTPPAFSAKKIGGKPAYVLARKGLEPILRPKKIHVFELEALRARNPPDAPGGFALRVKCSPGTYVRALAQDIVSAVNRRSKFGPLLGTCDMIRRIKTNGFDIKDGRALDFLEKLFNNGETAPGDCLMPPDFGLDGIPVMKLEPKDAELFRHGGFVKSEPAIRNGGFVRIYSDSRFIGIGEIERGVLKPKRVLCERHAEND
jgi:tRNA pseudouridine55 synthase